MHKINAFKISIGLVDCVQYIKWVSAWLHDVYTV